MRLPPVQSLSRRFAIAACAILGAAGSPAATMQADEETTRWQTEAQNTSIVRDDWGIAHVHGKTDADAVFGMIYAQAEDDFNRVETNYINAMGRLAEAEGESQVYQDLRMKLFIDPEDLQRRYKSSPAWLKALMVAWADGLNVFLHSHPEIKPRVIHRFEPWMALSFSEGSIGGDIERVPLGPLQQFYGSPGSAPPLAWNGSSAAWNGPVAGEPSSGHPGSGKRTSSEPVANEPISVEPIAGEPGGSNGIAIAPADTRNHHALLLINPHTSFFFRSELQGTSDEGLNVYGASTWGQFFIYQGFNQNVGWMHTSSGVDAVDFFRETVVEKNGRPYYRYGRELRAVVSRRVAVPYVRNDGTMAVKTFTVYRTHHGPVIGQQDGHWISIALMQKPVEALSQSWLRTKAHDYASFMKVMELRANSSNNTIFADSDGDIAYLHPQFVPRRDDRFDYTHPVDGADPATDWQGLHGLEEVPHLLNPATGWIMNTNDWPYSAAGPDSPKRERFPRYMDTFGENPRGVHATLLLTGHKDFTVDSLNAAAYDSYLPAFARLIPGLIEGYDSLDHANPLKAKLADPIQVLRTWDYRWSVHSVPTTLAAVWGDVLWDEVQNDPDEETISNYDRMADHAGGERKLAALAAVVDRLQRDFGSWRVPWGRINRYQRLTGDSVQRFTDAGPSIPIPFTAARWGSLASFSARRYEGTDKYYGTSGNSFVAIIEFGDKVSAWAVSTGGESGDPRSLHFDDQAARYADGALRPVYFYPADLLGHIEKEYRPH
jgi:acyl-homoserine-lactone acylase